MGPVLDKLAIDQSLEKYFGRKADIEKARECLKSKHIRIFGVLGMKYIGKSKFLCEIIRELKLNNIGYYDFELDDVDDPSIQYDWLVDLYTWCGNKKDLSELNKRYPNQTTQCGTCENCASHKGRCSVFEKEVKIAVKCLSRRPDSVLLLDHIDQIVKSDNINDIFLEFVKGIGKCRNLKVVFTSSYTIKTLVGYESVTLDKLEWTDVLDLLYERIERKPVYDPETKSFKCMKPEKRCFVEGNDVFTPENEKCLTIVAKLCEGLPLAVQTTGDLLLEDKGHFTPEDAVQLLIQSRLQTLSPENAPPSDRLNTYQVEIKKLTKVFSTFYENVSMKTTDEGCPVEDVSSGQSKAHMKFTLARPLLNQHLMSHSNGRYHVPGVLRECVRMIKVTGLGTDPSEGEQHLLACITENAKLTGVEIPKDCLQDPLKLEQFIHTHFVEPFKTTSEENRKDIKEQVTETNKSYEKPRQLLQATNNNRTSPTPDYSSACGPPAMSYKTESRGQPEKMRTLKVVADDGNDTMPDVETTISYRSLSGHDVCHPTD